MNRLITQSKLKDLFDYSPVTGMFTRLVTTSNKSKVGKVITALDSGGYVTVMIDSINYRCHRLAWLYMEGCWPNQIDHDDHDRANNKWDNLKEKSQQDNCRNMSKSKANTSGVTGVTWDKAKNKWAAQISIERSNVSLGRFVDKFEAICARMSANNTYKFHVNHGS